ncbi:MAG: hypothetical protein U1E65_05375 [Myxococcota bacterium]
MNPGPAPPAPRSRSASTARSAAVPSDGRSTVAVSLALRDARHVIAHTEVHYAVSTGTISEADILLNDEGFDFGEGEPGLVDRVLSVVLHEAGHAPRPGPDSCAA